MPRIALIPGDGIGKEVVPQAERALRVAGVSLEFAYWDLGADRYLREGTTITSEEFRALADEHDAILLGSLGDPRVPGNEHAADILLGLRARLDLYVNYRPCVLLAPELCPLKGDRGRLRIEIFRENTEGAYTGIGGVSRPGTPEEIAIEEDFNTRRGVERIVRAAFKHAARRGRSRVTMADKANVMRYAGGLWRRTFAEVAAEYPEIESDTMYVDALAMDLVRRPERYEVIVTSNLFGDIVSDLAAEVTGGLGLAPSANVHPGRHALFEPVHGSAPDIAGTGRANPLGAIRCGALLLEHLGHGEAGARLESAAAASVEAGMTTPDLGGSLSTEEVGGWIADRLAGAAAVSATTN